MNRMTNQNVTNKFHELQCRMLVKTLQAWGLEYQWKWRSTYWKQIWKDMNWKFSLAQTFALKVIMAMVCARFMFVETHLVVGEEPPIPSLDVALIVVDIIALFLTQFQGLITPRCLDLCLVHTSARFDDHSIFFCSSSRSGRIVELDLRLESNVGIVGKTCVSGSLGKRNSINSGDAVDWFWFAERTLYWWNHKDQLFAPVRLFNPPAHFPRCKNHSGTQEPKHRTWSCFVFATGFLWCGCGGGWAVGNRW